MFEPLPCFNKTPYPHRGKAEKAVKYLNARTAERKKHSRRKAKVEVYYCDACNC